MATVNFTADDVAAIEAALAAGVLRVTHNGTTTEYQSRADMMAQANYMRRVLGMPITDQTVAKRIRYRFHKGL